MVAVDNQEGYMASHLHFYTPSPRVVLFTQISILLVVMITGIISALLVRSQMHRHDWHADPIPIANTRTWDALR